MTCCPCDARSFPPEPRIPAGLDALPPQVLGFPEYRAAMLASVRGQPALAGWRARDSGGTDLGLLLVEWWAYVLDVLAFYDREIAQNAYLRTATDPAALRALISLIGYRPRPAVAAEALLAALVEAGPDVTLPRWTAFRSEAFGTEPPQVFESDEERTFSFRTNRWRLAPVARRTFGSGPFLFDIPTLRLVRGGYALLTWPEASPAVARVTGVAPTRALDGAMYAEVALDPTPAIDAATDLASIAVRTPTAVAGVNRLATSPVSGSTVVLDAVYPQIQKDQQVLVVSGSTAVVRTVTAAAPADVTTPTALASALPAHLVATQLTLSSALGAPFTDANAPVAVHFQLVDGGRVVRPAETRVTSSMLLPTAPLAGPAEPLDEAAGGPLLVQDRDRRSLRLDASVSVTPDGVGSLVPPASVDAFPEPLVPPVDVFGNVFHVVRGETVAHEVLGSGDATVAFPSFTLKKKPLTYVASAAGGRRSTLEVRVSGVRWREVESFYGTSPQDEVFIVRQTEARDSVVTFWRLPSGVDNVTARYRFGAGAAKPPANGITQAVRPVKGVRVVSPVAPFGGADADAPEDVRRNAPASALTLGRAVSLADFEALARSWGVVNVKCGWAWDAGQQRAVVKLWYVADGGDVRAALRAFLTGQADPNVPVVVEPATAVSAQLRLDLVVDDRFETGAVNAAVVAALSDEESGPLSHASVPIGGTIFRSALLARASAVAGVAAVNAVTLDGAPAPVALTADEGTYLDFLPFTNE